MHSGKRRKVSDLPMRVRRRQSDARWRANVASCYETLKHVIPVNKRACKRQISKAFILQETAKHINFLEGVLLTLLQEKAKLVGELNIDDWCDTRFQEIGEEFVERQREKIAALNFERKYKRNRYKLFICDNLPAKEGSNNLNTAESAGATDPSGSLSEGIKHKASTRRASQMKNKSLDKDRFSMENSIEFLHMEHTVPVSNIPSQNSLFEIGETITSQQVVPVGYADDMALAGIDALDLESYNKSQMGESNVYYWQQDLDHTSKYNIESGTDIENYPPETHCVPESHFVCKIKPTSSPLYGQRENASSTPTHQLSYPSISFHNISSPVYNFTPVKKNVTSPWDKSVTTPTGDFKEITSPTCSSILQRQKTSCFTPVKLPNLWQITPIKSSSTTSFECLIPGTPKSGSITETDEETEARSLMCNEDMFNSEEEEQLEEISYGTPCFGRQKHRTNVGRHKRKDSDSNFDFSQKGTPKKSNPETKSQRKHKLKCRRSLELSYLPPEEEPSDAPPLLYSPLKLTTEDITLNTREFDGYLLFYREKVKQINQESMTDDEVSKSICQMWKDLSEDQRMTMVTLAMTETNSEESQHSSLSEDLKDLEVTPMALKGGFFTDIKQEPNSPESLMDELQDGMWQLGVDLNASEQQTRHSLSEGLPAVSVVPESKGKQINYKFQVVPKDIC